MRQPTWQKEPKNPKDSEGGEEEKKEEAMTTISMVKHRIDKNSLRVLFHCLVGSPITTLKVGAWPLSAAAEQQRVHDLAVF